MQLGHELFSFTSEQHWINKAQSWFANCGYDRKDYIAVDSIGRVCVKGLEFMRASKENTYPITVYKLLCD